MVRIHVGQPLGGDQARRKPHAPTAHAQPPPRHPRMSEEKVNAANRKPKAANENTRARILLRLSAFGFLLLCVCGCQTAKTNLFTAAGPDWHVQQGQALWRPQRGLPEFGGDLVFATGDAGRCLIQFDKTPMTVLSAQTTSNRWLIKFPQRQLSFSGRKPAPTRLTWLYLPAALAGQPLPKNLHFQRKPDGGWRLENSRTGEIVEGFLSP